MSLSFGCGSLVNFIKSVNILLLAMEALKLMDKEKKGSLYPLKVETIVR